MTQPPKQAHEKGRVLVVDDNRDTRESLALLLGTMGYSVRTAGNGDDALNTALSFKAQFAILDVVMPGVSGFKITECFRKQPALRDMVIVTATSWQEEYDDFLSKNAGADYHLLKPIDLKKLQGILEAHLSLQ